jgi:hypothetical protein
LRQCPPLPIPNREVKPACADDTAVKCGKVGRRQSLQKPLTILLVQGFFDFNPCPYT